MVATIGAGIGAALVGLDPWHPLVIGPLVGLAAQAGDLAESLLKRAAGRKESGFLVPGHGGHPRPRRLVPVRRARCWPATRCSSPDEWHDHRRRRTRLDRVDRSAGARGRGAPRAAIQPSRPRRRAAGAATRSPPSLPPHPDARAWCARTVRLRRARARWAAGGLEELATARGRRARRRGHDGNGRAAGGARRAPDGTARRAGQQGDAGRPAATSSPRLLDELGGDPLDRLRPIDSEHSAIWQCLVGERLDEVARLVLTASGGPFRDRLPRDARGVTADEALAHPTWRMGPEDHRRLGHAGQQGVRGHRGQMALSTPVL